MVDIDDLVCALVTRQMDLGMTRPEANTYALGYLVWYVNHNLIDTAPAARRKLIAAAIAERVAEIEGATV